MEIRSRIAVTIFTLSFLFLGVASVFSYEFEGTVRVEPPYPEAAKIKVAKKYQEACSQEQISESVIISGDGYLKNVVVSLEGNSPGELQRDQSSPKAPVMDQKNCNFSPHILIVKQNEPFLVANSDLMAHDVRIFEGSKMLFRFEMDALAKPVEQKLERPGIYLLRCGLHSWMHAFVVARAHSYDTVTDEKGMFRFSDIPSGKYTVRLWHETLGETKIPIEVTDSIQNFSYTFPSGLKKAD